MQTQLVKLHVVQPGSSLNKLHVYPWRNVVCKTTAKKSSFSNYLHSLYSFNSVLNKSTYGVKQNIIAYKKLTCKKKYASQLERKKSKKVKTTVVFRLAGLTCEGRVCRCIYIHVHDLLVTETRPLCEASECCQDEPIRGSVDLHDITCFMSFFKEKCNQIYVLWFIFK